MVLKLEDRAGEQPLPGRDEHDTQRDRDCSREQHQPQIPEQGRSPAIDQERGLDPFGDERGEEAVGRARHQHQNVEQREAERNPPGADPGDARGIGQRTDQIDDTGQQADREQLSVH